MQRVCALLPVWLTWQRGPLAEVLDDGWPGLEDCWTGVLTPDLCCQPPPFGNAACWDGVFTYDLCCAEPRPAARRRRDAEVLADGLEACWMGELTPELCCRPPPPGNVACWDGAFTYDLCCAGRRPAAGGVPGAPRRAGPAAADGPSRGAAGEGDGAGAQHSEAGPSEQPGSAAASGRQELGARAGARHPVSSLAQELSEALASPAGCAQGFYQRFKGRAARWYGQRATSMLLIQEYTAIATHFYGVLGVCPAAALTAMLMKMEASFFFDEGPWSGLMGIYVRSEHRALAGGLLTRDHHLDGWPLVQGMEKLLALRDLARGGEGHARGPGGSGTEQEALGVVICYCDEDLGWLRHFHEPRSGAPGGSLPAAMRARVALYIYHKCGALGGEAREVERSRLEGQWGPLFRGVEVRYVDDVVRADDCSGYLAFISDRYDSLPEFVLFLHADAHEHIIDLGMVTDLAFAASRGFIPAELGFVHLSHNHIRAWPSKEYEFSATWKQVFSSSVSPPVGNVSAYCCVQFFVRRSRIQLRPRRFYDDALNYFAGSAESNHRLFPVGRVNLPGDAFARFPCQLAMFFWHVIFGEPLDLPRRQHDPSVPLFLKLGDVEIDILDEGEGW